MRPTTRLLLAWLALLAMLFGVVAPTAACAFTGPAPLRYMEICTAHGIETIALDGDKGAPAGAAKHCDGCVTHCHPLAPPSPTSLVIAHVDGRDFLPPLFYRAPRPLHAWTSAAPRGPPAVSC